MSEFTTSNNLQQSSIPTASQKRGMRHAIISGCLVGLSVTMFTNGLMLLYFNAAGIPSVRLMVYLSLPLMVDTLFKIPLAHLADRLGLKRMGIAGALLEVLGFTLLTVSGFTKGAMLEGLILFGSLIYGLGMSMYFSGWFALLRPLIPQATRGRFFGKLRLSWQSVVLLFTAISAIYLTADSPLYFFQILLGIAAVALVLRIGFYLRIPDLNKQTDDKSSFKTAMQYILQTQGFVSFGAYIFLLALFTLGAPMLFGLIEKRELQLGDDQIMWLGNLQMFGSICGYYLGGKLVDRLGTKPMFLICHFGYSLTLILFLLRGFAGDWMLVSITFSHLMFGVIYASSSIAITTETLSLMPALHQSLFAGCCRNMTAAGGALSGLCSAWLIKLGLLKGSWVLMGNTMTQYDSILLCFSGMIVFLVVTLGLVPSVLRKAEWIPRF